MNAKRERARTLLEDAVYQALEAGMAAKDIIDEVKYALETAEDDS